MRAGSVGSSSRTPASRAPVTTTGPWVPPTLDNPLAIHAGLRGLTRLREIGFDDPPGFPRPTPMEVTP